MHQQNRGTSGKRKRLIKIKFGLEKKWEEYRRQKKNILFKQRL